MSSSSGAIPYYKSINDFLSSIVSGLSSSNENIFCLRMMPGPTGIAPYKPPYKKDFYFISLITNAGKTKIGYDINTATNVDGFLVTQAPGLTYSFFRDTTAEGYIIYFKKELLDIFKPDFDTAFPFFNPVHTNFYTIDNNTYEQLKVHFLPLFNSFATHAHQHQLLASKLLSLLYEIKEFSKMFHSWEQSFTSPAQLLFKNYLQLVNSHYLELRTVEEYAARLHITANHLSQTVKQVTQKNALHFINERIITEAKYLIQYTAGSMAEIAYQLNFSDPANFGKFFKKHTGQTPLEFRKEAAEK